MGGTGGGREGGRDTEVEGVLREGLLCISTLVATEEMHTLRKSYAPQRRLPGHLSPLESCKYVQTHTSLLW